MQYFAEFYSPELKAEKKQWYFPKDFVDFPLHGEREERNCGGHRAAGFSGHY